MSRPCKFKAWDDVKEKMYGVGEESDIHFYFDSEGIKAERFFNAIHYTPEGESFLCSDSETLEHLIYLEYSGLKDSNDLGICEGDIVYFTEFDVLGSDNQHHAVVEYDVNRSEFMLLVINSAQNERFSLGWVHYQDDEIEVVGNRFEHPHLLGGGEHNAD